MQKYIYYSFFLLVFFTGILKGQSPGGIPANNKLWLKSDNGVSTTGPTVTQWQDFSGASVTGNFTVQSLAGTGNVQTGPTLLPTGINFNPYLSFNGTTNSLSSINNFLGTALVSNSTVTAFQVLNLKSGVVWLKWENDFNGSIARFGFENSAGRLRFDFPRAVPATAGQNVGVTNILNLHTLSTAYVNTNISVNRLNGADDNTIPIPGPGNFASATTKLVIGNENLLNLPCRIDLAEIIVYSNSLTATERKKIESYLAVKYGFTLNQLAANNNDYIATNDAITWNRTLNSGYANDITGIGRDDATALNQKQSKSVNTSALLTLYNGTYASGIFPVDNASNTNTFSNNFSFLLTGDNGSSTAVDQCALDGNAHRMQRIWKASRVGVVSPVTIAVDQASVPAIVKNILVSSNPSFPLSGTTSYPVTAANGILFSAVTLNHNDYFTFSSDTIAVPIVQNIDICSNSSGTVTVSNPVPGAVYNWYNQATGGILAGTGVSITLPNLQMDTTLYIETISQFNCILPLRVPVTIRVQTVALPQASLIQPTCTIPTGTITLTSPTGTGFQYCLNGTNCQTGLTFAGLSPGMYDLTAINTLGCISPVFSFTINTQPPNPAAPVLNGPVSICTNQPVDLLVTNPVTGNTYNWFNSSTSTNPVFTGIAYTTPPVVSATSYYAETVNIQGCVSSRAVADIFLKAKLPSPVINIFLITDSSILFSWLPVPGANNYLVSTDGISYFLPSSGINGTVHILNGLLPRTTHTLFVQAIDTLTPCLTSNDGRATGKTKPKYDDVYVPSAFTPNSDMINNRLRVFGDIISYQFNIFNRYGQRVFTTTTLNAGWDGKFKDKEQPTGTYVWNVTAKLSDGRSINISGTSILIR